jgi:hypothetical protein
MVEFIPDVVNESGEEDIQLVQKDIQSLADKYIVPVDQIRSTAKVQEISGSNPDDGFKNLKTDQTRRRESRAHAFLRYIGFPVGTADGFYNPGWPPTLGDDKSTRKNIDAAYSSAAFKKSVDNRERDPETLRGIFVRKDAASSTFTLMLSFVRPFNSLDEAKGPFDIDEQKKEVDARTIAATLFKLENPDIDHDAAVAVLSSIPTIGPKLTGVRHILRPFVVDPRISNTVQPSSSLIAIPFLPNKQALKIDNSKSVQRPGLELIIRERLRDRKSTGEDSAFFDNIKKILTQESSPTTSPADLPDENTLRLTVSALLDDNKISDGAIDDINGITGIQIFVISRLVKTIKALTKVLFDSIVKIDEAKEKINWIPVPSEEGPELGAKDAKLTKTNSSVTGALDKSILDLELRKAQAKRRITQAADLGAFASPFSAYMNDDDIETINANIAESVGERDSIANDAFKAMGNIELISGEVSGLGLIDILSVYVALWSMDEKALISLLDQESFDRMSTTFPELIVGAAADRKENGTKDNITTALKTFENRLINVLTFAETQLKLQGEAPKPIDGGTA